jgi:uroporphyrin-III C-methyltransferase / precorrin-2 dehydrogenase / sirohydrochlorin ferrochelatase
MESLPLFHRLAGRKVLVLGEGEAADAKTRLVEEAGGIVVREPGPGVRLAFVAMEDAAEAQADRLRALGMIVNVVDKPALCDFTVPAIIDRSPVIIAIGTGGASASLAKALKERLELLLPTGLGALANAIKAARRPVAAQHGSVPERRAFWAGALAPNGPLDPLQDVADAEAAIARALQGQAADAASRTVIEIGPEGAEALTLRELRLMAGADLVIVGDGIGTDVLALVRRDASRLSGEGFPDDATGRIVLLRLATKPTRSGDTHVRRRERHSGSRRPRR